MAKKTTEPKMRTAFKGRWTSKDDQVQNISKPDKLETISADELARCISSIAKAMKALSNSRLKREAIVTLIADRSKLGKGTIELVLNNLEALEEIWLKKGRAE